MLNDFVLFFEPKINPCLIVNKFTETLLMLSKLEAAVARFII